MLVILRMNETSRHSRQMTLSIFQIPQISVVYFHYIPTVLFFYYLSYSAYSII